KRLIIDARNVDHMATRTLKEFSEEDIQKVATSYHAWRGTKEETYEYIAGFCKAANLEEVREHDYILIPGRYVGLEEEQDDGESFDEKMERLKTDITEQFKESKNLEDQIRQALGGIGYEV